MSLPNPAVTQSRGALFPPEVVSNLVNLVNGKSSLAKMSAQKPLMFNGQTEFTFTMDNEVDLVAENGPKRHGGIAIAPRTIVPLKVEYGARISDEFKYAAEERRLEYMNDFAEGFSKKVARGLDIMAMHGVNPRTGLTSSLIGTNCFDQAITNAVTYGTGTPDDDVEAAIALISGDYDPTGMIMGKTLKGALAGMRNTKTGERVFPELAWGNAPGVINGMPVDTNSTVEFNGATARAYVGDFATAFRWGIAKALPLEVIEYGCPDNDTEAGDLKGHNQVYLRSELYLGWAILDPDAFARISA